MSLVGRATMKQAMDYAKAEMKLRAAHMSKYESLLLHLLDGGSAEDVHPVDQRACLTSRSFSATGGSTETLSTPPQEGTTPPKTRA